MTLINRIGLAEIEDMRRVELIQIWTEKLGYSLPKNASTSLLKRAIGFEVQARQIGDLSKAEKWRFIAKTRGKEQTSQPSPQLRPGVILLRQWNGRNYEVRCTDDGFEFDGVTYKSLSKIARHITGAHWSGPRFFGLVKATVSKTAAKAAMAS